jgi:hypothetical protein
VAGGGPTGGETVTTCPKCGFSYGWDGEACRHCNPPAPDPSAPPAEADATERSVGWLDRIVALLVFPVIGVVFGCILGGVLGGWETLKDFFRGVFLGGDGGNPAETAWVSVLAGLVFGVIGGVWFAWELTFRKERRRRRSP